MKNHFNLIVISLVSLACSDINRNSLDLDRMVHTMTEVSGGDSAIAAIETHVSKYINEDIHGTEVEKTIFTVTYKRPDKLRFDIFNTNDILLFSQSTNGKEAWAYLPDEGVISTHQKRADELISWAEHWIDEWRIYKNIDLKIEHLEDLKLDDILCHKMLVTDRFGIESYWYVNSDTYLMARIDYPDIDLMTGKILGTKIYEFKEFHHVGVLFPTKEVERDKTTQEILANREMVKWVMNNPVNDSIFNLNQVDVLGTSRYLMDLAENGANVKNALANRE